jgi:hypothetical protein
VAFVQIPDDAGNPFVIIHAGNLSPKTGRAHPVLAPFCLSERSEESLFSVLLISLTNRFWMFRAASSQGGFDLTGLIGTPVRLGMTISPAMGQVKPKGLKANRNKIVKIKTSRANLATAVDCLFVFETGGCYEDESQ